MNPEERDQFLEKKPMKDEEKLSEESKVTDEQRAAESVSADHKQKNAAEIEKDDDENHADENHADYDDEDEDDLDFSELEKKDLLKLMIDFSKEENPLGLNRKVQEVKKIFNLTIENEKKHQLSRFLEDGNDEVDFEYKTDPINDEFFAHFKIFKVKKKEFIDRLNKEKEDNLKAKLEILEKLKALTDDVEHEHGYSKFKKLLEEWRNVGHVPKGEIDNLWKNYHFHVNKFYDNLQLYSEFKELDRKKNLEAKMELCTKLEELKSEQNLKVLNHELRNIQNEWNHIGPVPNENREEIMNTFNVVMADVIGQKESLEEGIREEREENYKKKLEIVEKIETFGDFESVDPSEWVKKNEELGALIKEWKTIGFVPYAQKDEIANRFRDGIRAFNRRKNKFFKNKKKERVDNLKLKQGLIEKVRVIMDHDDTNHVKTELINLQKEWKNVGPVPPKYSKSLWKEFRGLCDEFFNKLSEQNKAVAKEQEENLVEKTNLCEEIEAMVDGEVEDPEKLIMEMQSRWSSIGFVPFKNKDAIFKRFNKGLKKILENSKDKISANPELINFKLQVAGLKEQSRGNQLKNEERRLFKELKSNEEEITTLETNIQFFNNSKNAVAMVKDYEKKILRLKEKVEAIKEKLDIIKS